MWSFILDQNINPLQPGVAFLYPLKISENLGKPKGFLMFSGGIEKQHRMFSGGIEK